MSNRSNSDFLFSRFCQFAIGGFQGRTVGLSARRQSSQRATLWGAAVSQHAPVQTCFAHSLVAVSDAWRGEARCLKPFLNFLWSDCPKRGWMKPTRTTTPEKQARVCCRCSWGATTALAGWKQSLDFSSRLWRLPLKTTWTRANKPKLFKPRGSN